MSYYCHFEALTLILSPAMMETKGPEMRYSLFAVIKHSGYVANDGKQEADVEMKIIFPSSEVIRTMRIICQ